MPVLIIGKLLDNYVDTIIMRQEIQNTIQYIEQTYIGLDNPYWTVSRDTAELLQFLVFVHRPRCVLEIGTSIAYSTLFVASALEDCGGLLYTVESHVERLALAGDHITRALLNNIVVQIHGHAPEILSDIDELWDMVFFDATKMEHLSYIQTIESRLSPHALVIADNVISHAEVMKDYVNYISNHPDFISTTVAIGAGLLVSIKKSII